ncbi:sensor histidine kinase [Jiangella alkaliphila]|uniref:histidine kinase n=1 Tax=Jiangella alkaliphila TaxID=419479 RepID=A0A1H2M6U4_9ACTN|nr:histidine kinase [Jiangella alkaliphila]SDU88970.1 Histidine kinase [Jiangella alkaliphila]
MNATPAAARARNRRDAALWAGWAALVAVTAALAVWALRTLIDLPGELLPWALLGLVAVPVAVTAAVLPRLRRRAVAVAGPTLVLCGLVLMVLAVYLVVVIGLGGEVDDDEQGVLAFSMLAALTAVVLAEPVRGRLRELAEQWAGRPQRPAASALETFGSRMTRAVPMDELLLQLAETLRSTLGPLGAEVWTGEDGVLERTVSVPERGPGRLTLAGPELAAVTRARVSGTAWAAMWLPSVLPGERRSVRVASVTHLGRLLGLLVVVRSADDPPFRDDDDRMLADLARQVGLALHNVRLDSALQASLEELRRRNAELQASRARIVSAADASRRQIERNLHDGAQQRLVALAVKLGLARRLATGDSAALLEELRTDVQETLTELRELAHGIYPPLLREHGLGEALRNAAGRAAVPTTVEADGARYLPEAEAAVYFCCLEALQNAGKHAGPGASATVRVGGSASGGLEFEVADDGAGFDPAATSESHGFVNMRDRLGAFGGELTVDSAPGAGTVIRGTIPTAALAPAEP